MIPWSRTLLHIIYKVIFFARLLEFDQIFSGYSKIWVIKVI